MTATLPPLRDFVVVDQLAGHATVCTSLTDEQAVTRMNLERANGFGWVWSFVKAEPCDSHEPKLRHLLLRQVRTQGGQP